MSAAPAFVLDEADYLAAERAWRWYRNDELSPGELAAEIDHWRQDLALLQGDLASSDFRDRDEQAVRGGIAYAEHRLGEVMRAAERMMRARSDPRQRLMASDLTARFEAAKLVDLVDLAQTLTGQEARKAGRDRHRLCCPFHADDTPSLVLYGPGLGWHCFVCGIGGYAVDFVAELKKIPAVEALSLVERLCDVRAA